MISKNMDPIAIIAAIDERMELGEKGVVMPSPQ